MRSAITKLKGDAFYSYATEAICLTMKQARHLASHLWACSNGPISLPRVPYTQV